MDKPSFLIKSTDPTLKAVCGPAGFSVIFFRMPVFMHLFMHLFKKLVTIRQILVSYKREAEGL